jgi:hypothetical protein
MKLTNNDLGPSANSSGNNVLCELRNGKGSGWHCCLGSHISCQRACQRFLRSSQFKYFVLALSHNLMSAKALSQQVSGYKIFINKLLSLLQYCNV